jgi:hypothetical protein
MWAGMSTTEHEYVPGELPFHKPTGIRLERPEWAPHGMPHGPWTLRSGPGAGWAAEFKITSVRPRLRARALGLTYDVITESTRFRREFGWLHTLDRAVPVAPTAPVPWDAALAEVFATLFFLLHDTGGFRRGEPAYPDRMELKAPELPAELRGTVVASKYGQAWS